MTRKLEGEVLHRQSLAGRTYGSYIMELEDGSYAAVVGDLGTDRQACYEKWRGVLPNKVTAETFAHTQWAELEARLG